ncbi:tetratricopeptide repeat protein [Flavobacterium faecale]|uniref:tetratricopeptide repeat protein n=1 Tax=Flavobacterium faecale TaxID=1355330 RepID=UPI003AAAB5E2
MNKGQLRKWIFLLMLIGQAVVAQGTFEFNKKFINCEEKWVVLPISKDSSYVYGFVYIDTQAGLAIDIKGSFKMDAQDKLVSIKENTTSRIVHRLEPNTMQVAIFPEDKFAALQITKTPEWLAVYKTDENTVQRFFRKGFVYNAWNECVLGLSFLEKAQKLNPAYKGLATELAFSYNCAGRYSDAIKILEQSLQENPADAYTHKELIYAQTKSGQIDKAIVSCQRSLKVCKDQTYAAENSFQVLHAYFTNKDHSNFDKWLASNDELFNKDKRFLPIIEQMKNQVKN